MSPLAPLLLLLPLAAPHQDDAARAPAAEAWAPTVLLDAGTKLGGCAVGELDPDAPGLEVAAVAGDGGVWLARRTPDGWRGERVASLPGEAIQCTVGDVDPRGAGNEIVCVGMARGTEDSGGEGAAYVVRRAGAGWETERVCTDGALLHGVAISGKASEPRELLATGFTNRVYLLQRREGSWTKAAVVDLPGAGKNVVATSPAAFAVACNEGSLVLAAYAAGAWQTGVVHKRGAGRARLAFHGDRVLVADDDGVLWLVRPLRAVESLVGPISAEEVLRTEGKLRGAVFAELDPTHPALEVATAGYGGRVLVAAREGDAWRARVVHEARERFHHVAAADLDGAPGDELVVCGYSGELLLLRRPD